MNHNEEPIDTIKREVKEELGIEISDDNIVDLGYIIVDLPVRFIFYLRKNVDLKDIVLEEDEVERVSYMNESKLRDIIEKGLMNKSHAKVLERILEYKKSISIDD